MEQGTSKSIDPEKKVQNEPIYNADDDVKMVDDKMAYAQPKTTINELRGFGFVQFVEPADAEEAKYHMDGQILMGPQMTVVFAEKNRKKPSDMRLRERRTGSRFSSDRRRSPPPRYSRSPCLPGPHLVAIPDHHLPARDYSPAPRRRHYSRSVSPLEKRYSHERSYLGSPVRDRSPSHDGAHRSPNRIPVNE